MPARFLILGASSFYGRSFAEYVRRKGDDVDVCENRLEHHLDYSVVDADYVVNFASKSLVAESWERPWEWTKTNVTDTTALIYTLRKSRIKKFVHVSTPESYGHTDDWVDETYTAWRPSTPYAVSRAAADMMIAAYHHAYGFPAVITRTANIYGPGQQPFRIIPFALDKLKRGEKVPLHGNGATLRCFIHVRDACAATYIAAKEGLAGETYHISTREPLTIAELVRKLCKRFAKPFEASVENVPERLGKDMAYLLSSDKIRAHGWHEKVSLDKGLEECASSL